MSTNIIIAAVACITMLAAVQCYDEEDSLDIFRDHQLLERNRREGTSPPKSKWKEIKECCTKVPMLLEMKNMKGCFPEPKKGGGGEGGGGAGEGGGEGKGKGGGGGKGAGNFSCGMQCAYKKQEGMVTAADIIDYTAVGARLAVLVAANKPWAAALNGAYADCTAAPIPPVPENHQCKSGAAQLNYCMLRNSYMRCPVEAKKDTEKCTKILNDVPNWGRKTKS